MNSFLTAVRTLTVFPVPAEDPFTGADGLIWFPVVGAGLGLILYGLAKGGDLLLTTWGTPWPEGTALGLIVIQVLMTGALHVDGLADWADARSGRTREERLSIMGDSMLGTFGLLAVVFSILARFVALSEMISAGVILWLVPVLLTSRMGQVHVCVRFSSARSAGTGAGFVRGARFTHWLVAAGTAFLFLGVGFGAHGLVVGVVGLLIGEGFGRWNTSQLDGVTGDVLGACNEWIEVLLLIGLAAVPDQLPHVIPVLA